MTSTLTRNEAGGGRHAHREWQRLCAGREWRERPLLGLRTAMPVAGGLRAGAGEELVDHLLDVVAVDWLAAHQAAVEDGP